MAPKDAKPAEPTASSPETPATAAPAAPAAAPALHPAVQEVIVRVVRDEQESEARRGLRADTRMTLERAERVALAEEVEELNKNPRNVAIRPGGMFRSSGGEYVDGMGVVIPLEELPEALQARVKGEVDRGGERFGKTKNTGADNYEPSHREKRDKGVRA